MVEARSRDALKVIIEHATPMGLLVRLPDRRQGLIRTRELSWDSRARQHAQDRYRVGQEIAAVPIAGKDTNRPELSVRLAQDDPWLRVEERYCPGALLDGIVTGIAQFGIFVELEPGVTGLVHQTRLPGQPPGITLESYWPGDMVKVIVSELDPQRRRIELDMRRLDGERWADDGDTPRAASQALREPGFQRSALDTLLQDGTRAIMIAGGPDHQRDAIADWLDRAGQRVVTAATGAEAIGLLAEQDVHVFLFDPPPAENGGTETLRQVRERWPQIRCALLTEWNPADEEQARLDRLAAQGVAMILKPVLPEDILDFLISPAAVSPAPAIPAPPAQLNLDVGRADRKSLLSLLQRVRSQTRASHAILFQLHAASRRVALLEQVGRSVVEARPDLIHSPVRDVAEDRRIAIARDAADVRSERYRHLAPLLPFSACLGVPVPAGLSDQYALFLFFERPGSINEAVQLQAEAAAVGVALWLERRHFVNRAGEIQRLALLGHLSSTLVHEVNHQLSPVVMLIAELQARCRQVEGNCGANPDAATEVLKDAHDRLNDLAEAAKRLTLTVQQYGSIAKADYVELVMVEELVNDAMAMVVGTADRANVKVVERHIPRFEVARLPGSSLGQVLVNVVLNAVQQIEEYRGPAGGRVQVGVSRIEREGRPFLQITVEDDGPGVHRRLWERIFELGFTTREGGSGLGLYISRGIVEGQGGRIYIAESHMQWGTRIAIELPAKS